MRGDGTGSADGDSPSRCDRVAGGGVRLRLMTGEHSSADRPPTGRCACGQVRFVLSAPLEAARYCHCHNCQRRTGTSSSANARIRADAFTVLDGEQLLRS